jgi:alcohol dehydrogenase
VAAATRINIEAIEARASQSPALAKYARAGRLLGAERECEDAEARGFLIRTLADWTRRLALPSLSSLGVAPADLPRIVANSRGSSMKTNPIVLEDAEVERILLARL